MTYLLDTNVCIRLLNNTSPAVTSRLANNLILVTHNTAEFSRVRGLQIEDWELD
ncbi:MAG: type II toxin-antitoxin system VapC family toxin [Moorea sp. SIO3G5]|nr:type II toxin-antitoxin system VapC family toxin [Moorena sp. SIO3G5]